MNDLEAGKTCTGVKVSLGRFAVSRIGELSNPGRLKDPADVQEMIRELKLPADFVNQLDTSVREQFATLWNGVHSSPQNQ